MVEERVSSQTGRSPTSDILLLLRNKSDIDLLRDELQTDHNVRTDSDIQSDLDLVILDVSTFEHRASRLREKKESEEPVFLPYLLVKREREEVPPVSGRQSTMSSRYLSTRNSSTRVSGTSYGTVVCRSIWDRRTGTCHVLVTVSGRHRK